MRELKSCGVLAIRSGANGNELLVMKHKNRLDLPKGHIEPGESEQDCAFREWEEETGASRNELDLIQGCQYHVSYQAQYKRFGGETVSKTVILFAARVASDIKIHPTEHFDYEWLLIEESVTYQSKTIEAVMHFLSGQEF